MRRTIACIFVVVILVSMYTLFLRTYMGLSVMKQYANNLYVLVQDNYLYSALFFSFLLCISTLLFIPVTVLLTIFGGFLFGPILGAFLVVVGVTVGAYILFMLVRFVFGDFLLKRCPQRIVALNKDMAEYGAFYLLILQFLPFTPTFVINLFAGASTISASTFIWTTAIGMAPGTIIYSFGGQYLHAIHSPSDILSWPLLLLLVCLSLLTASALAIKRYIKKTV